MIKYTELTELDFLAYDVYLFTKSDYPKMNIRDFSSFVEYSGYYYNEANKILRKDKLKKINLNDDLITDLYNIRSFDDIINNESKIVNKLIRAEKIEKLNKLME